jgi:hypothetical protein
MIAAASVSAVSAAGVEAYRPGGFGTTGGGRPIPDRPIPTRPVPALPLGQRDGGPPGVTSSGGAAKVDSGRIKEPYDYRYYKDTDRGSKGCYWMAERAIKTNNGNWWNRYRACLEVK